MLAANLIINKLLQTKDFSIIKKNGLESCYFDGYEDEFNFIVEHYKKYGNIPDEMPFAEKFPDFEPFVVNETDDYLIDKLHEEYGYKKFTQMLPVLNEKLKDDSRVAYEYLRQEMANLKPRTVCNGIDIIENFNERFDEYLNKRQSGIATCISTGFAELDDILNGWECGDELVTITGRTGAGKSWILMKFLSEAWKQGKRVGLYSGEMNHIKLGYRFDTLYGNQSNLCLTRGAQLDDYEKYGENLKQLKNKFIIATQKDFGGRPTVSQLRNFVEENEIEILGIDQLSLMEDERTEKYQLLRIKMGHIAEDLFALSSEYRIPILALAQTNREGAKKEGNDAPTLENIKESDDIAHNSSKCLSIRQSNLGLIIDVIKNREGITGAKLLYNWDIDIGQFEYIPSDQDGVADDIKEKINKKCQDQKIEMIKETPF